MSCSRRADHFKATDGNWYLILGNREYAYDDHECTAYGPFYDNDAIDQYIHRHHSNPGHSCIDDSGTDSPPDDPVRPRRPY